MALEPGVYLRGAAAIERDGARETRERSPIASVALSASRAVEGSRIGEESRAAAPVGEVAGATRAGDPRASMPEARRQVAVVVAETADEVVHRRRTLGGFQVETGGPVFPAGSASRDRDPALV